MFLFCGCTSEPPRRKSSVLVFSLKNFWASDEEGLEQAPFLREFAKVSNVHWSSGPLESEALLNSHLMSFRESDFGLRKVIGSSWSLNRLRRYSKTNVSPPQFDPTVVVDNDYHLTKALPKDLERILRGNEGRPFFLHVQIDFLSPPYLDPEMPGAIEKLSLDSKKRISQYMNNPEKYPDKTWLFTVLFDDRQFNGRAWYTRRSLDALIRKNMAPTGWRNYETDLMLVPELVARWRKSVGVSGDLRLLKELYDFKFKEVDRLLSNTITLIPESDRIRTKIAIVSDAHQSDKLHAGLFMRRRPVFAQMKWPHPKDDNLNTGKVAELIRNELTHE